MYNDDLESDVIGTGTHKKRYAKVTMYLEVDSLKTTVYGREVFKTEDEILEQIEKNVQKHGISLASFSDIVLSPIEGDDISKFKNPVGYLTPDGKFFLIESEENGLAHLALSERIYQLYKDEIESRRIYGDETEKILERFGCIKIHKCGFRYYSLLPYGGYYDQKDCKTPKINDIQFKCMVEFLKTLYPKENYVSVNSQLIKIRDFKQMDLVRINEIFNFENDD